ncbi:MAG: molybdate ABC transporter substrate-binding protein [Acidimicrobiia bacterium]|nr:molybdate ABC transporter substrate-binding protein [Acidimicrobiia bacterium]MYB24822.1 molybdate ABC transporter substrate-binding protein [Acidimicrobiia bacterium]MYE67818.1 molybdate ABC transporter substrate-binding protein [Acidimicrobiia bacterium]
MHRAARARLLWAACTALLAVVGCVGDGDPAAAGRRGVTVFAASSLTDVFGDIAAAFEAARPDVEVTLQFAGSSRLATQINAGAPADVFASADARTAARVDAQRVTVFARNRLAVAVPPGNPADVNGLASLTDRELVLAICAPEVPCGTLTERVGGPGLVAAADTREPGVRGVLTKVLLGEVDAGMVYVTDVLAAGDAVAGIPIDHPASTPYSLALLSDSPEAAAFVDFVLSPTAQELLAAAGFEAA